MPVHEKIPIYKQADAPCRERQYSGVQGKHSGFKAARNWRHSRSRGPETLISFGCQCFNIVNSLSENHLLRKSSHTEAFLKPGLHLLVLSQIISPDMRLRIDTNSKHLHTFFFCSPVWGKASPSVLFGHGRSPGTCAVVSHPLNPFGGAGLWGQCWGRVSVGFTSTRWHARAAVSPAWLTLLSLALLIMRFLGFQQTRSFSTFKTEEEWFS